MPRKSATILVLLAVLVTVSHCAYYQGYDSISTLADPANPVSCLLTLRDMVTSNYILLNQTGNLNNCQFSPITMSSLFAKDSNYVETPLVPTMQNSTMAQWSLTTNLINDLNGTACIMLPQVMTGNKYHLCHLKFSAVDIYLEVFINDTQAIKAFDTAITGLMLPNWENSQIMNNVYNTVARKVGFPNIVATMYSNCNLQPNSINLNDQISIQPSNGANLSALLPSDMYMKYVILRKKDSVDPGKYMVVKVHQYFYAFTQPFSGTCYKTPIPFSIFNQEPNYCTGNGCLVSFIMADSAGDVYILETKGFTYFPKLGYGNGSVGKKMLRH